MSHGKELELSDPVSHPSPMKQDALMLFTLMMSYLLQEVPKGVLSSSLSITSCLHPLFIPATHSTLQGPLSLLKHLLIPAWLQVHIRGQLPALCPLFLPLHPSPSL